MRATKPAVSLLATFILLAPSVASAHVGLQTFELLAGALHPWINLQSGLVLFALALWLTQWARSTDILPFLAASVCVGAGVGIAWWLNARDASGELYGAALLIAGCVSMRIYCSPSMRTAVASAISVVAGYGAGIDAAPDVKAPMLFIAGAIVGSLIAFLGFAALFVERNSPFVRTGFRILGSWVAAISLMLLALRFRR